ncbi:MAG: 3-hydroxyacyl-CoA dehydrogenase family protein [Candidatus Freyarchaeota archaeon]|nr:3-hydroxyacyl-CoA dehydrogenase family protein [Candidatus Freyrarchaeum guaymaensis]
MRFKRIACVGAGVIGHSWAAFYASKGLEVKLQDISEEALRNARELVGDAVSILVEEGLCDFKDPEDVLSRIDYTLSIEDAVKDADFIQESVVENYDVKKQVFKEIDRYCPEDAIIASSTSGLLMTEIQKAAARPERCIVAHPFNPPHLMPLVELAAGEKTDEKYVREADEFFTKLGKVTIILKKENPNHVANNFQKAVITSVIEMALQGIADWEDLDKAMEWGPGIRWAIMGPLLTFHLAGGEGGIVKWFETFAPQVWEAFPQEVKERLIKAMERESKGKSIRELNRRRDKLIVGILKLKQELSL